MSTPLPEPEADSSPEGVAGEVLVFTVERQEFALPVDSVVEIARHREATPVPRSASAVDGIVPLRGQMVTILDLRRCLALPPRPAGTAAQVIVVGPAGDRLGLVVDGVSGVARLPAQASLLDIEALLRRVS